MKKKKKRNWAYKTNFELSKRTWPQNKGFRWIKKYLAQNKDVTVQKVIEKFGDMNKKTVYNYFKKLNYTYS
ncbi:hypothetical protein SAP269_18410 [Spiroplasma ixodetis]|uniref:Transposase n=1 Tax=Spiroplasma ixodetis TaxID=2141 RepID=A0ABN7BWD8_9MOLU